VSQLRRREQSLLRGRVRSQGRRNATLLDCIPSTFRQGDKDESGVKCTNCKVSMTVKRSTLRVSTLAKEKGPPASPVAA